MKKFVILFFGVVVLFACSNTQNKSVKNDPEKWMNCYSEYITKNIDTGEYKTYTLCHIDADTIPELCLIGRSFASGVIMLTQQNGDVVEYSFNSGLKYIERTGLIDDEVARMGTYEQNVYLLTNGGLQDVLHTSAIWHDNNSSTIEDDYFVFRINGDIVDTLSGNDVEDGCSAINDKMNQLFYSQGKSKCINGTPSYGIITASASL